MTEPATNPEPAPVVPATTPEPARRCGAKFNLSMRDRLAPGLSGIVECARDDVHDIHDSASDWDYESPKGLNFGWRWTDDMRGAIPAPPPSIRAASTTAASDPCVNGHPFEPGVTTDDPIPDPNWCNVCGEARLPVTAAHWKRRAEAAEAALAARDAELRQLGVKLIDQNTEAERLADKLRRAREQVAGTVDALKVKANNSFATRDSMPHGHRRRGALEDAGNAYITALEMLGGEWP